MRTSSESMRTSSESLPIHPAQPAPFRIKGLQWQKTLYIRKTLLASHTWDLGKITVRRVCSLWVLAAPRCSSYYRYKVQREPQTSPSTMHITGKFEALLWSQKTLEYSRYKGIGEHCKDCQYSQHQVIRFYAFSESFAKWWNSLAFTQQCSRPSICFARNFKSFLYVIFNLPNCMHDLCWCWEVIAHLNILNLAVCGELTFPTRDTWTERSEDKCSEQHCCLLSVKKFPSNSSKELFVNISNLVKGMILKSLRPDCCL